jgi:predicted nucleic acid-binding protein
VPRKTAPRTAYRLHVAEPKAEYTSRPPLVIDASVIAAALFGESGRAEATALLHGRSLHAPHLIDHEIASVALKKMRREHVSAQTVAAALEAFARLPIERHAADTQALVTIADRCALTAYDAAYLFAAEQLTASLATLDGKLAAAARAYLSAERQVHEP